MGMSTLSSSFSSLELQAIYSVDQQLCSAWHLLCSDTRQWAGKWNKSLAHENWSKNSLKKYPRDWSHSSCIKTRVWKMLCQRWVVKKAWNLLHSCSECVRKKSKMADLWWLSPRSLLHWVTWKWGHKFHCQHGIHFAGQPYDTSMIWIESPLVYI